MGRVYTGIGARMTPPSICAVLRQIAVELGVAGYTLRSGRAPMADQAFERGAGDQKEIYLAGEGIPLWAFEEAQKYVPVGRPKFGQMSLQTQQYLARDMQQVLGEDGTIPSKFVVCWTLQGLDDGGTGYAIRCAIAHEIPVYNLRNTIDSVLFGRDVLGVLERR